LKLSLACPVSDPTQVIDVAVADQHRRHRRQGAVGAAGVEGEVKLWKQDDGSIAGS
jgi:hypothetical protein